MPAANLIGVEPARFRLTARDLGGALSFYTESSLVEGSPPGTNSFLAGRESSFSGKLDFLQPGLQLALFVGMLAWRFPKCPMSLLTKLVLGRGKICVPL